MQLRALMFRLSFTYIYTLPGLKCDWPGEAVSRQALRTAVPIVLPPLEDDARWFTVDSIQSFHPYYQYVFFMAVCTAQMRARLVY